VPSRRSSAPYRAKLALGLQLVEDRALSVKRVYTTTKSDPLASRVASGALQELIPISPACALARLVLQEPSMKSSVPFRKLLASDARVVPTAPLSDLRPGMIVKSALTTRSIPKPAVLLSVSARNVPKGSLHRLALTPKTNAQKNAPVALGPVLGTYHVPHVNPEHHLLPAPNLSAIAGLAVRAPLPVQTAKPNATSALPEHGAHQQVKAA